MIFKKTMLSLLLLSCTSVTFAECNGRTCNGLNPFKEINDCPVSNYTRKTSRGVGTVTLKYSKACNANWALVEAENSDVKIIRAMVRDKSGNSQVFPYNGNRRDISSPMIDGSVKIRGEGKFKVNGRTKTVKTNYM